MNNNDAIELIKSVLEEFEESKETPDFYLGKISGIVSMIEEEEEEE